MLKNINNNKGFTVIELIASFVFSSILAISLFTVVLNYRDKETDTDLITRLQAFKSNFVIDVEQDIQKKGLYSIDYCINTTAEPESDEYGQIIPRCAILTFDDGDTKTLAVKKTTKVDTILNRDGVPSNFDYVYLYIEYGDIKYNIPDETNVDIVTDYFLEQSTESDGLETNNPLYKIRIDLVHKDLPTNIAISIVASGSKFIDYGSSPYSNFNIGDLVTIQLNESTQRKFRVIQPSSGYNEFVTLLYDDVYDNSLLLSSTEFNTSISDGNDYNNSSIKINTDVLASPSSSTKWVNASRVRLITADEVGYIIATCPKNSSSVATSSISLASAPSWLVSGNYWTMTGKVATSEEDRGKMAWYVNGNNKTLNFANVNEKYAIRPVIEVSKVYITAIN